MRIVFMGTPDFAVPSLEILIQNQYNVVGVVTSPDKNSGRGQHLQISPVKKYALEKRLKILQPDKLKDPAFLSELSDLKADLQVVVAFRMLPEIVWAMPPKGTINLHASLLPEYRGAAPINWAIINGESQTGVTTFFIEKDIDTGCIIFAEKVQILDDETANQLHDKLLHHGAILVLKTVRAIEKGNFQLIKQILTQPLKKAPKIFREDCKINWNQSVEKLYNFIRGLSPYPTGWTIIDGKIFKIYTSIKEISNTPHLPGTIITDNKCFLKIAGNNGYLTLLEVQAEGKKRMSIEEFLRGTKIISQCTE